MCNQKHIIDFGNAFFCVHTVPFMTASQKVEDCFLHRQTQHNNILQSRRSGTARKRSARRAAWNGLVLLAACISQQMASLTTPEGMSQTSLLTEMQSKNIASHQASCHLIYVNAHVFYVHHVSFNDRMLSSLHRTSRIALHQVTGAAAELVLDSDWMGSASPSQLLPCATARVASSTDRCITFRNRLPCASLVRSTQILESFHAGSATSQLRCSTGAGAGMSTISNYAILACPMLQTSSATSARKQRVCSALVSRTQLSKSTSL